MLFHEIIRPSVGPDVSQPSPIYRPGWLFRYPDYFVHLHHWNALMCFQWEINGQEVN